jgi:hypothetical protein
MSVSNPPTSGAERPSPPLSEEKFDQQEFVASLSPAARAVLEQRLELRKADAEFDATLGYLPLSHALNLIGQVSGERAWPEMKKALERGALRASCSAEWYGSKVRRTIRKHTELDPAWLDYLSIEKPDSDLLYFYQEKTGQNGVQAPMRASNIVVKLVDIARVWKGALPTGIATATGQPESAATTGMAAMGAVCGAPDDLRPASDSKIDDAITRVYDEAIRNGEKPPNIRELPDPVLQELRKSGYIASGNRIMELGEAADHARRRRKPGKTLKSEKRKADFTK